MGISLHYVPINSLSYYRADIKAILVIVASLLPSLYPWDDSSPNLKLTHSCCSSLAHALLAAGDSTAAPGSWQDCVDLAHFGLHPVQHESSVSQLVSLVSLHNQWGLLVEVSVQRRKKGEEGGRKERVFFGSFSCRGSLS